MSDTSLPPLPDRTRPSGLGLVTRLALSRRFHALVETLTQIVGTDDEARDKAIAKPRIEVRAATPHSA